MDSTANEIEEVTVEGFPTLKLFKKGTNEIVDYEGKRDVKSMVEFLKTGKQVKGEEDEDDEDYDDYDEEGEDEDEAKHIGKRSFTVHLCSRPDFDVCFDFRAMSISLRPHSRKDDDVSVRAERTSNLERANVRIKCVCKREGGACWCVMSRIFLPLCFVVKPPHLPLAHYCEAAFIGTVVC